MKLLETLEKYILLLTIFLFPLGILAAFPNFYDTPKIAVLVGGICLVLILKSVRSILKGSFEYARGSFDLPVIILVLAYLISAIVRTPSKMDAFFLPGTASFVIGGAIIYFLLNSYGAEMKKVAATVLFFSAVASSLIGLLAFSKILSQVAFLPTFVKDTFFTPLGGQFPSALFLAMAALVGVGLFFSEKEMARKSLVGVSLVILGLGLAISIFNSLPGKDTSPTLPPFNASWEVAIEAIKSSPILGVGGGNYLTAFNVFRPISYNNTKLWPLRFTTAADWPLTVTTEAGLLGLAGVILLFSQLLKRFRAFRWGENMQGNFNLAALGLAAVLALVFPVNPSFTLALFVLLSLSSYLIPKAVTLSPSFLLPVPIIAACLALAYFTGRALAAEATFKKGLDALVQNNGTASYEALRGAIGLNPYVDRYHATYAQVNLALARALAQKETLTESERNTVAQLIQQSIREGRATVTLNPGRSSSWEVLARTYQAVMAFATGADQFTITSFNQAIALDPINPNLRIALGGVYYALGRYDDAVRTFELAVLSKPDLANSHYNLAAAYREKDEIEKAIEQINVILSLVEKDSQDYQVAKAELENLEKKRPATEEGSENLTPPAPAEEPVIKPPLTLPEEANPPAGQ